MLLREATIDQAAAASEVGEAKQVSPYPATEPFTHTAGFGGMCALIAAVIAFLAASVNAWVTRRNNKIKEWWDRYTWTLDRADTLGAVTTYQLLAQLTTTAAKLKDQDLIAYARQSTVELYNAMLDTVNRAAGAIRTAEHSGTLDDDTSEGSP